MAARIALIHAVRVAMDPIAAAFARGWPEAETVNLLDDGLSRDLERRGTLEGPMTERIGALAGYASGLGADGILYTCSAFGAAIDKARAASRIPVGSAAKSRGTGAPLCGGMGFIPAPPGDPLPPELIP